MQKLAAVAYDDYVYTYSSGVWAKQMDAGARAWTSITSSRDGTVHDHKPQPAYKFGKDDE